MSHVFLPVELWIKIAADGCFRRKTYYSLVLVSRTFYDFFIPMLYASLEIQLNQKKLSLPRSRSSKFKLAGLAIQHLLDRLNSNETFRGYVRDIHIKNGSQKISWADVYTHNANFEELVGAIMALASKCPNLRLIHLRNIRLQADWIYQLATIPTLQLSISLKGCFLTGEPKLDVAYNVISLECSGNAIPILYPIIFGASLQRLTLRSGPWRKLAEAQDLLTFKPSLVDLRYLSMIDATADIPDFLKLTPNVVVFRLDAIDQTIIDTEAWKHVLPKLQSFCGPIELISPLVTGRPVTSLKSCSWYLAEDTPSISRDYFGSAVPIRAVHWGKMYNLKLLEYLAKRNPLVEEFSCRLGVDPPWRKVRSPQIILHF
jgi:hypothetical protein